MTRRGRQIDQIETLLHRIEAALVVQNPGTVLAAEAFDGLRKTLLHSAKSRRAHVAHLVSLRESLDRGAALELISERVDDFLAELGVYVITDTSREQHFVFDGDADGPECVVPAIIDVGVDGSEVTIREGQARRRTVTPPKQLDEPDEANPSSAGAEGTSDESAEVADPSDVEAEVASAEEDRAPTSLSSDESTVSEEKSS